MCVNCSSSVSSLSDVPLEEVKANVKRPPPLDIPVAGQVNGLGDTEDKITEQQHNAARRQLQSVLSGQTQPPVDESEQTIDQLLTGVTTLEECVALQTKLDEARQR